MKHLLYILNHHPPLKNITFGVLAGISRITGVPAQIIRRAQKVNKEKEAEYSLGLLAWFIAFRLRLTIPDYNIYHLIGPEDQIKLVSGLLKPRVSDYRIAKQYYLLHGSTTDDEEFKSFIKRLIEDKLTGIGQPVSQKPGSLDTDAAFKCLCETLGNLAKHDIQAFLVSGTLLGFIREDHLLKHDNDLDIGVFAEDATINEIIHFLQASNNYTSVYDLGHMIQATHNNGTIIDIFLHYQEGDQLWHGTDIHRWFNSPFKLTTRDFRGNTFLIPDNPERYLDENYGDWHRPALFWDYSFDTPNQIFSDTRKAVFFLVERILKEFDKPILGRYQIETAMTALSDQFGININEETDEYHLSDKQPRDNITVITFGTFDLFHIGHLNILKRAATYGDKLIVGVSSDKMNFSKKNAYPVYNQDDRMNIVNAFGYVDEVFLEESLELKHQYIETFNADVLIMGDDWEGEFDDMSDICEVIYLPRTEDISTTKTKDSIKIS